MTDEEAYIERKQPDYRPPESEPPVSSNRLLGGGRTYLLVCSGECYNSEIVAGDKLLDAMMNAIYGTGDHDPLEVKAWRQHLLDPDHWCHDPDRGPVEYHTEVGEIDRMRVFLLTEALPGDFYSDVMRAVERMHIAAVEFINDWQKGDFRLPTLAKHDANALKAACVNYESARVAYLARCHAIISAAKAQETQPPNADMSSAAKGKQ